MEEEEGRVEDGLVVSEDAADGGMEIAVASGPDDDADELTEIPHELPVLPLKNTVLFPYLLSPLLVNTPASQRLIDDVLIRPDRLGENIVVRVENVARRVDAARERDIDFVVCVQIKLVTIVWWLSGRRSVSSRSP